MDAPDRDLCHRYTDRRLWLARDHDRLQPTFAGVTAREPRVCQADKALFRLRENNELRFLDKNDRATIVSALMIPLRTWA